MSKIRQNIIGVIHLPALPGAPDYNLSMSEIVKRAVEEAKLFENEGFGTVIIENFGDRPFFKTELQIETVSALTVIAHEVKKAVKVKVGLNFLRNAALQALSVATVTQCDFIRVNILSGAAATDQGIIEGCAAELSRLKKNLNSKVDVFADVLVKHARQISTDHIDLAIEEVVGRGGAKAVIVSGETTGREVDRKRLEEAAKTTRHLKVPLYIGSGANAKNVKELLKHADGIIVSSSLRKNQIPGAPLDVKQMKEFIRALR